MSEGECSWCDVRFAPDDILEWGPCIGASKRVIVMHEKCAEEAWRSVRGVSE